jgi:16S rRNA (guanine966-N2)-methyltransferase
VTRIVAGAARGRRLTVPRSGTRPTSDRAREALFSSLESTLRAFAGVRFLDLYAGTGAVGLEAASRGASAVWLVESDRSVARVLHANVAAVGLAAVYVRVADVRSLIATTHDDAPFDVAFLDPPYTVTNDEVITVINDLVTGLWLADDAVLVVERPTRSGDFTWPPGTVADRSRRYGETTLWYGRRAPGPPPGDPKESSC